MLDRSAQATIGACLRHVYIVPSERESFARHSALVTELTKQTQANDAVADEAIRPDNAAAASRAKSRVQQ